jgi:hypothetical protein
VHSLTQNETALDWIFISQGAIRNGCKTLFCKKNRKWLLRKCIYIYIHTYNGKTIYDISWEKSSVKYGIDSTGSCEHGIERSDTTEDGHIFDELSHYLFLKEYSVSCI